MVCLLLWACSSTQCTCTHMISKHPTTYSSLSLYSIFFSHQTNLDYSFSSPNSMYSLWFRALNVLIAAQPNVRLGTRGAQDSVARALRLYGGWSHASSTGNPNRVYNEIWCLVGHLSMVVTTREGRCRSWCWMWKRLLFPLDSWTYMLIIFLEQCFWNHNLGCQVQSRPRIASKPSPQNPMYNKQLHLLGTDLHHTPPVIEPSTYWNETPIILCWWWD